MKCNFCTGHLQLAIALAATALLPAAHARDAETQFKYSDEWSLVSAPPPAGPYQPVNIDPRVPGPGTIPEVPMPMPRLHAADEPPAEPALVEDTAAADAPVGYGSEAPAMPAAPEAILAMPPVPGHYQPLEPPPEVAAAAGTGGPGAESPVAAEAAIVTAPAAAAPALASEAVGTTGSAQAEMETVAAPPAETLSPPSEAAPALAIEATEPVQTGTEPATVAVPAMEILSPPAETAPALAIETTEPSQTGAAAATAVAPSPDTLSVPHEIPPPAMAESVPPADRSGQPATALQQGQPYYPQQYPMPGFYDRLAPPAAGRTDDRTATTAPGPAESLREPSGADYAPAPGYYGRRVPAPGYGYGYQAPGYPYQGMPAYRGNPSYGYPQGSQWPGEPDTRPYGYSGGQTWSGEQDVPPPPVYDSMQRPREPIQGYR